MRAEYLRGFFRDPAMAENHFNRAEVPQDIKRIKLWQLK